MRIRLLKVGFVLLVLFVCALHLVLSAVILPLCCQFESLHRFLVLGLLASPLYLEHHDCKFNELAGLENVVPPLCAKGLTCSFSHSSDSQTDTH